MEPSRSCGAIVFRPAPQDRPDRTLEILLVRYGHDHWGFPKGRMEPGETEEETAIREVREETGVEIVCDLRFRRTGRYVSRHGDRGENVFFAARPLREEALPRPQLSEVSDARWFDADGVRALLTFPGDYDLYLEARGYWEHQRGAAAPG